MSEEELFGLVVESAMEAARDKRRLESRLRAVMEDVVASVLPVRDELRFKAACLAVMRLSDPATAARIERELRSLSKGRKPRGGFKLRETWDRIYAEHEAALAARERARAELGI